MATKIKPEDRVLDRRVPTDYTHVEKYPAVRRRAAVARVERRLMPPSPEKYRAFYDQGNEGACVGFGESLLMSILNRKLYDPWWLYREAQIIDEWTDTPPAGGTSLRAGFDVLRDRGHRRMYAGKSRLPEIDEGVVGVNRWLGASSDEGRGAIADGHPIVDGIAWFDGFYRPERRRVKRRGREVVEYWMPPRHRWGQLAGYHCIVRSVASDERQAFGFLNSWGTSYPWPVFMSYEDREHLHSFDGEAAIVTDR